MSRDPAEIEAVVKQAVGDRERPVVAIARRYGCSIANARYIIHTARQRGANIPLSGRGPLPGNSRQLRSAKVAEVACEAIRQRVPIAAAVAAALGCSYRSATYYISNARVDGHQIPYDYCARPNERTQLIERHTPQPRGSHKIVLQCRSCDETVDHGDALVRHTLTAHRRPPTREERTPVASTQEVAA